MALVIGFDPISYLRASHMEEKVLRKVLEEAPSMRAATGIQFSEALEQVLAKALSRDPRARHSSTGAFVAALEAAASDHVPPTLPWIAPLGGGLDAVRVLAANDLGEERVLDPRFRSSPLVPAGG